MVDDAAVVGKRYDRRWLHVDDAVQAFEQALTFAPVHRTSWPGPGECDSNTSEDFSCGAPSLFLLLEHHWERGYSLRFP